ncbi:MAG: hypothetical protein FJZ00_06595, partial [Candidatus Sericytochromatia bacterium]|nr:hypothetical protein [Candidatus Tanganyikabacteria bacterium]
MAALRSLIVLVAILACGLPALLAGCVPGLTLGGGLSPADGSRIGGGAGAGLTGANSTGPGGQNATGLISDNGSNLFPDHAAGLVSDNAAALISDNGANLISDNAAHLVSDNAAGLRSGAFLAGLVAGPNALISDNAAHLVSHNAGGLISDNAASLISDNASRLVSGNASSYRVQSLAYRTYKNVLVWFTHPDERFYAIGGRIVAGTTDERGRFRSAKPVVRAAAPVIANVSLPFDRRMVRFLTTRAGSNSLIVDAASTYVVEYLRHEARRRGKTPDKFDLSRLSAMTDRTRVLLDSGALSVRPEHFVTGSGELLAADFAVAVTRSDRSLGDLLEQTIGQRSAAVATFAGNWEEGSTGDGGPAGMARIAQPWGLAALGDALYIAEVQGHKIRRVAPGAGASASAPGAGTSVSAPAAAIEHFLGTFAGHSQLVTPRLAIDGVPAGSASPVLPRSVALDADGNVFFSFVDQVDRDGNLLPNQVVAMLCRSPSDRFGLKGLQTGTVYRVAGTGASQVADASGTAVASRTPLGIPSGIALGAGGDLLIA